MPNSTLSQLFEAAPGIDDIRQYNIVANPIFDKLASLASHLSQRCGSFVFITLKSGIFVLGRHGPLMGKDINRYPDLRGQVVAELEILEFPDPTALFAKYAVEVDNKPFEPKSFCYVALKQRSITYGGICVFDFQKAVFLSEEVKQELLELARLTEHLVDLYASMRLLQTDLSELTGGEHAQEA